jgi:hypothetical protein
MISPAFGCQFLTKAGIVASLRAFIARMSSTVPRALHERLQSRWRPFCALMAAGGFAHVGAILSPAD